MRSLWRASALALAVWAGTLTSVEAQTISQPLVTASVLGSPTIGQSFTATLTGFITKLEVRSGSNGSYFLRLYNGPNGTGVLAGIGSPAYSQTVALTALPIVGPDYNVIDLDTPFPVVAGQTYSFSFDSGGAPGSQSPSLALNTTDAYAGGTFIQVGTIPDSDKDLTFQIYEAAPPPAPIPTLSDMALAVLAILLISGALVHLSRRGPKSGWAS